MVRPWLNLDPTLKTWNLSLYRFFEWSESENHDHYIKGMRWFSFLISLIYKNLSILLPNNCNRLKSLYNCSLPITFFFLERTCQLLGYTVAKILLSLDMNTLEQGRDQWSTLVLINIC